MGYEGDPCYLDRVVEMRVKNGLKSENPKLGVVCGYSLECGNSCWILDGGRLELKSFILNPNVEFNLG